MTANEAQMKSGRVELEKRILRLHKGGTGILKIGKALGIGTGTVQPSAPWSSASTGQPDTDDPDASTPTPLNPSDMRHGKDRDRPTRGD